jgi:hypothetical protein
MGLKLKLLIIFILGLIVGALLSTVYTITIEGTCVEDPVYHDVIDP